MERKVNLNIITLGDNSVGKTSILTRLENGSFNEETLSTMGYDKFCVKKKYEKKNVIMNLWFQDTAGQDRFQESIPAGYIRNSHIVLLVFCDIETLNSLKKRWIKFYEEKANLKLSKFILVGNKSDIFDEERDEIIKQGEKFAEEINAQFITCSAKSADNMDNLERFIINEAKELIDELEKTFNIKNSVDIRYLNNTSFALETNRQKKKSGCKC